MGRAKVLKILIKGLIKPSEWSNPQGAVDLKLQLEKYFNTSVFPLNSGRGALYLILKALGVGEGDEVIIQAYTCNAVPNPILWLNASPIYADIERNTLNVDPASLKSKITKRTKAIVLQHTFGRPGPIEEILEIARKHNLFVIEDCAHSLGGSFKNKKLGTFGDMAILSFGREKVISSLSGGAILVNNPAWREKIEELVADLKYSSYLHFLREINNYFTWRLLIRKIFFTKFGKELLYLLNSHDFFNVVSSKSELIGNKPSWYPALYPGTFAKIALGELPYIDTINKERLDIAKYYEDRIKNVEFKLLKPYNGVRLRFVLLHKNPASVFEQARKRRFWFGNWYSSPVYPERVDLIKMHYILGSCPAAEEIAAQTINLPSYKGMGEKEMAEVVNLINSYQ